MLPFLWMEPLNILTISPVSLMVALSAKYHDYYICINGRKGSYMAKCNPIQVQTWVDPTAKDHPSDKWTHQKNLNKLKIELMYADRQMGINGHGRPTPRGRGDSGVRIRRASLMVWIGQGLSFVCLNESKESTMLANTRKSSSELTIHKWHVAASL